MGFWDSTVSSAAAVSTVASALAAIGSAWYARNQLREAKVLARDAGQPYLIVDIGPSRWDTQLLVWTVENMGNSLARDVRIEFTPPIINSRNTLIRDVWTSPALAPGVRLEWPIDSTANYFNTVGMVMEFVVRIQGVGPYGVLDELHYPISLGAIKDSLGARRPDRVVAEEMKKVARQMERIADDVERRPRA